MKIFALLAALTLTGVAAQPAVAQVTTRTTTVVRTPVRTEQRRVATRHTVVRTHSNSGWHAGYPRQRVCTVRYRDHRRVRVCRWH